LHKNEIKFYFSPKRIPSDKFSSTFTSMVVQIVAEIKVNRTPVAQEQ